VKHSERWYRKAVVAAPAALVFLGAELAGQGRLAEAKRCHRRATRLPDDDRVARGAAYCNLALILRAERRYRDALVCFDRAIALDPKYVVALKARADVRSALKVGAPEDRSTHWRQMLDEYGGEKRATAHELAREYARRYPDRPGGWFVVADILVGFARYADAASALRRAQRVARVEKWTTFPNYAFALQWGLLYQQKKDFKRAEASFRRAVALRRSGRNLTHLAELLVMQGRLGAGKRYLTQAIRMDPGDSSTAYYDLGLIARARGEYGEAVSCLNEAIRQSRVYPLARRALRDVQRAMKVVGARR